MNQLVQKYSQLENRVEGTKFCNLCILLDELIEEDWNALLPNKDMFYGYVKNMPRSIELGWRDEKELYFCFANLLLKMTTIFVSFRAKL